MTTLQIVFIAVAAGLMLCWFAAAVVGLRKIDVPDVIAVLRHGAGLRTFCLFAAMLPPMVMAFTVVVVPWRTDAKMMLCGLFVPLCLPGSLLIEASYVQILVTAGGVIRVSPWRGRRTITWTEIECVQYSSLNSWFVVVGAGRCIRVSRHLIGVRAFVAAVKSKLGPERYASADKALDAIR